MTREARRALFAGTVLLLLGTCIGAMGTHALKPRLSADNYAVLQVAVQYQFLNALGLLGVGLVADRWPGAWIHRASLLLIAGVALFSGSLYLILMGVPRWFGVLTPIGGVCLMLGWAFACVAVLRTAR
jgi:uncharacterized membrane protein YgdD (TMEM256/DUF423 family)